MEEHIALVTTHARTHIHTRALLQSTI